MVWREAIFRSDRGIVPKSASWPTRCDLNRADLSHPRAVQPLRHPRAERHHEPAGAREFARVGSPRPVGVRRDAGPTPVEAAGATLVEPRCAERRRDIPCARVVAFPETDAERHLHQGRRRLLIALSDLAASRHVQMAAHAAGRQRDLRVADRLEITLGARLDEILERPRERIALT
jgi:hypothetical protein